MTQVQYFYYDSIYSESQTTRTWAWNLLDYQWLPSPLSTVTGKSVPAETLKAALSRQPGHHPDVLHPFLWLLLAGRFCNWRREFCPVVQIQLMKTVGRETALKIWALTSWHGEVHRIPFRSPSPSIFPIRDMLCLEANLGCKSTG